MCGCSGTSVKMSSRFMFNVKNNRSIARRTNISSFRSAGPRNGSETFRTAVPRNGSQTFRTAVPRNGSEPFASRRSSNRKRTGFRSFYFSY